MCVSNKSKQMTVRLELRLTEKHLVAVLSVQGGTCLTQHHNPFILY